MHRLAGLDAKHHVLRVGIVFAKVVAVVGRDHRHTEFMLQPEEVGVNALFLRQALVLNFEKEIAFAEDVVEVAGSGARGLVLAFRQALGDFALQACRRGRSGLGNARRETSC